MAQATTATLQLQEGNDITKTGPSEFTAIVTAAFDTSARSSGSLESNASSAGASTLQSIPSLETSHSASSAASASSSANPSPCPSILRSNSAQAFPSSSTPSSSSSSPTVTFAPLPQVEPRKRNSSHPLGVAARSRLLRNRRMLREGNANPGEEPSYPYGPGSGVAGGRGVDTHAHAYGEEGVPIEIRDAEAGVDVEEDMDARAGWHRAGYEQPVEDPLVSLGRFVKGAGKTLWKSLSMRDIRAKERERDAFALTVAPDGEEPRASQESLEKGGHVQGGERRVRGGSLRETRAAPRRMDAIHLFDNDRVPPLQTEEGGVWEEELAEESWKKLLSKPLSPAESDGDKNPLRPSAEIVSNHSQRIVTVRGPATAKAR